MDQIGFISMLYIYLINNIMKNHIKITLNTGSIKNIVVNIF